MSAEKYLRIYLNDHNAGGLAGLEVAKRCLKNNRGTRLGDYLETFIEELEEDRGELLRLIDALGFPRDRLKEGAGWAAEKAGRLKFNGHLTQYSDLSRVFELEGLVIGVTGKLSMWRNLQRIADTDPRIAVVDLDRLEKRAERQREELDAFKLEAAERAFR